MIHQNGIISVIKRKQNLTENYINLHHMTCELSITKMRSIMFRAWVINLFNHCGKINLRNLDLVLTWHTVTAALRWWHNFL